MNRTRKAYLIAGMVVAEALITAALASAQLPSGQDGRAMDANNRVGSGGMNAPSGQIGVTPNQIVYGNVTGGKQFRGPVGSRDPGAFTGPSPGRFMDRFVASSSGVPFAYQPQVDLSNPQPFYGAARNAPPPVGSVRVGYTGAYLGTDLVPSDNYSLSAQYAPARDDYLSQRLGVAQVLGTRSTLVGTSAGESYMQPVGGNNQDTTFSGSALYGIQPLRSGLEDQTLGATGQGSSLVAGPGDRFRVDSAEMRRMRSELENPADQQQQQNDQNNQNTLGQPGFGQSLNAQDNSRQANPQGFSNDLQSGQPTQRRYTIVSPEIQSAQYREMRERLSQYENPQFAQMEAQHRARMERQAIARKVAASTSQPATPGVGVNPEAIAAAGVKPGMGSINPNAEPVKVTSLATGVRAKGLHDMLTQSEDLMRQGKFQSAIDRYDVALQIAPNNPLISLGRANAELGAGAYRLAAADLRRVFSSDHATLVAQYDLKAWFPAERLEAISKELSDLSSSDPKDPMPEFLQAYIAYNTAQSQDAARHLAASRKRSAGNDPLLDFMERDWKLPPTDTDRPPQPDFNK
jgi:hypothetical protein